MGFAMKSKQLKFPISIFWEPMVSCNLSCKHCYTSSSPMNINNLSESSAFAFIDLLSKNQIYSLSIGGGEPLLLNFLPDLIRYAKSKDIKVSISTNGLLLTQNLLNELIDAGLEIIQISIDGLKSEHEELRGKNTFDKVIKSLKIIQKSNINYRVACVINKINYRSISKFINFMYDCDVKVINFFRYMPINNNDELCLNSQELLHVSRDLISNFYNNKYGEHGRYITFEPLSFFSFLLDNRFLSHSVCTAGLSKFVVDNNGDTMPCNYYRINCGNIEKASFSEIWKNINCFVKNRSPIECKTCKYLDICNGGCKGFSFVDNCNIFHRDPSCFYDLLRDLND